MHSESTGYRLNQQERSDSCQAEIDILQKSLAMQAMIDDSAEEDGRQ